MNLIEALKAANGKPVGRREAGGIRSLVDRNGKLRWNDTIAEWGIWSSDLLADDWYVVEPKSKIEEAIEAVATNYFTGDRLFAIKSEYANAIRRIVNITLDEAVAKLRGDATIYQGAHTIEAAILALKVKE